jgi:outer membrane protein assembly factor BamD (BamD/ComL family)
MNRRLVLPGLILFGVVLAPFRSPAPLIYTPGEGWRYEAVGEGNWQRTRAKDQLVVAQDAFDKKDYSLALKAARRVVRVWPTSDYTPQAQYVVGRSYEERGQDERAFKEYQVLIEKYPKAVYYEEVMRRQYEIANRFLGGQWFKLWDYIPSFPSMEKTAGLFEKIVKNGPYSDIGPQAQMKIGEARVKQGSYPEAVKAFETAADRYNDRPQIAADALYRQGQAYHKQAARAEYDQSAAAQAIAIFKEFMGVYSSDPRVPEAQRIIGELKGEQARGSFETAKFYEKKGKWLGARTYYNEVVSLLQENPESPYAVQARERIDAINRRLQLASQ